MLKTNFRTK